MNTRWATISLGLVTVIYLLGLVWADSRREVFTSMPAMAASLPVLFAAALTSCLLRFARWQLLLRRAGHGVPVGRGLLAYFAGFAFTATPGKAGELVRIRYLMPLGVPPERVIAAFVYERALDLLVVLAIASLAAKPFRIFPLVATFVTLVMAALFLLGRNPRWIQLIVSRLVHWGFQRLGQLARILGEGLAGAGVWMNPRDLMISLLLGGMAWSLQSLAFVWLLDRLGAAVPSITAIAILPLAQLAGAASMLPGGIGSTEAAIVSMLLVCNIGVATATLAAVGIRISTLWGAILWGLAALLWLEHRRKSELI